MLTFFDYVNVVFYFAFIAGVGVYFARKSRNTSDYFRGGGVLPWWVTGASTWMVGFSAWTFTGAAGKMYQTGPYVFGLYYSAVLPLVIVLIFTCYRFRRMRVVTPFEGVRLRYGPGAQQFFTWIRLPFLLLFGGVALNAIAVFMAAVLGMPVPVVIVGMGVMVTLLSLLGGSFGVAASDFVQMFLIVTVTLAVAVLALIQPEIGGISGMIEKAPAAHYDWGDLARPGFIALWVTALLLTKITEDNSIDKSAKYLMTRNDRHARLTLIIPIVGTLVAPLVWLVPPTVAAIQHPDLASMFPNLRFPEEAAFLATAAHVLPHGMLGLLICGIFAATLTTMDAGLNQGAGIFVRNFYLPVVNPDCPEKRLLIVSKLTTGILGLLMIVLGLMWSHYRNLGLFDLVNQVAVSLNLPLSIPLFLGLFYKRTPPWSTWSTVLIGLVCSFLVRFALTPESLSWVPGIKGPFTTEEVTQFYLFATVLIVGGVCVGWYFFTTLFYERSSAAYKAGVEEFFERLRTSLQDEPLPEGVVEDQPMARVIGRLCVIYGAFVSLLALIPNSATGRLCFVACGGVMLVVGGILVRVYRQRADIVILEPGAAISGRLNR